MASFGKLVLTNEGLQAQALAQGGTGLKFSRIKMGDGNLTGNVASLSDLVSPKVSLNITNGELQNAVYTVSAYFDNKDLTAGFYWKELGVFIINESGKEVLYAYANAGANYDYIPATADEKYAKWIRVATAVGNATNLSIVESEGILYVDTLTFEEKLAEIEKENFAGFRVIEENYYAGVAGDYGIEVGKIVGRSVQDGTPTPDAPVEIQSFGVNTAFHSHGFQLFDASRIASRTNGGVTITNNEDGSFTVTGNGTLTDGVNPYYQYSHEETVKLIKNGKLTLNAHGEVYPYFYAQIRYNNGTENIGFQGADKNSTKEIPQAILDDETSALRIGFYGANGYTIKSGTIKPMLYQDGDGTWEPFHMESVSPQSNVITWDGDITGREKHPTYPYYKVSDLTIPYSKVVGKKIKISTSSTIGPLLALSNPPQDDKSYMYLYEIMCVMDDSQGCSPGLYFYCGGGGTEVGAEPYSYVEAFYPEETADVSMVLRSLPNGVCDTYEDGKIIRRVGAVTLVGGRDEDIYSYSGGPYSFVVAIDRNFKSNSLQNSVMCSHLQSVELNELYKVRNEAGHYLIAQKIEGFVIMVDDIDTPDGIREWLKANHLTVLYELAEPFVEAVTIPVIPSWAPNTAVHHDSEVEPTAIEWKVRNGVIPHPIGSVIITVTNKNPAVKLGGSWELIEDEEKSASHFYYWKRIS